ncbi:hypothetical protein CPB84DRAFT_1847745 [Gymnopilus junonius]|uniref:CxC2-like cysteine cluster KDZ transposase-associated domain-containing protein n=1 Tax=Gymnopilus junonius TaxID=109634 RepID=A0A9P5NPI7_GYMJU|nr:hypothetical protein CPB84DRAFT_1847745 [Gymnopilus junonius]
MMTQCLVDVQHQVQHLEYIVPEPADYTGDPTEDDVIGYLQNLPNVQGTKTQNDYLHEWLPHRPEYLKTILEMAAPTTMDAKCQSCKSSPESTSNAGLPLNDDVRGGMQPLEGYDLGPNPPTTFEDSFYATTFEEVGPDAEDEGNEEEDSLEDLKNSQTNLVLQPSSRDQSGNPFIAIIDVLGVHHLPVVHCTCRRAEDDILFLEMGLFPASFDRIRTVFTFNVLTDFWLSNLECKTSAYQYYQKL